MKKVLLAGATGYLGSYIVKELQEKAFVTRVLVRTTSSLQDKDFQLYEIVKAELTEPDTIKGCCDSIDAVISTVGITRQKEGLTYMDVDYQANMNLLREARKSGVKKFTYVSVLNGESLRHLKICEAKERFVDELKASGLDYCVIRPNGFFSDMADFFQMAKKGRVYLFGKGTLKTNPIHGKDLATVCVDAINKKEKEILVGGPETLTHQEIASSAFDVVGSKPKVTYIPEWIRASVLKLLKMFTGSKTYGPIEFFMTVMAIDMVAPEYGKYTLKEHFASLKSN
ncbi:MAG: SDR family oxidoreductase [Desulfobacterales bacterium]|nr:SDR family oxidoreductase [Desulfobacterales bacterium]